MNTRHKLNILKEAIRSAKQYLTLRPSDYTPRVATAINILSAALYEVDDTRGPADFKEVSK